MSDKENIYGLAYCRVSSDSQKRDGSGLDGQEHRVKQLCKAKKYEFEKAFCDSISGGGDFMKRPAMVELLEHIDNNPHKKYVVIFDDLSRLARDVVQHIRLRQEFDSRGVGVECLNFKFENTPEGEMVEVMMAAQNQYHRKNNRRTVIQKQKARLDRGYLASSAINGYKSTKHELHGTLFVPDEPRASMIKDALKGLALGRFSSKAEAARFLVSKGFTKNGRTEVVNRLLKHRVFYAGYIENLERDVTRRRGHHQPIIDDETLEGLEELFFGAKKTKYEKQNLNPDFPLRREVLCIECKHPLTGASCRGKSGKKFPYYWCKRSGCLLKNKMIKAQNIHEKLEQLLKGVRPTDAMLDCVKADFLMIQEERKKELREEERKKESRLQEINKEVRGLIRKASMTNSLAVTGAYEERIEELKKEEAILHKKSKKNYKEINFEHLLDELFEVLKNPLSVWKKGDLLKQKQVLRLVFAEKLVYDREVGFQTPKMSLVLWLFGQNSPPKTLDVEMVEFHVAHFHSLPRTPRFVSSATGKQMFSRPLSCSTPHINKPKNLT